MPTHMVHSKGEKLKRHTRNWKDKVLKVSPTSYKHTPIKTVNACVGRCALKCLEKITRIVIVSSLSIQHSNNFVQISHMKSISASLCCSSHLSFA